MRSSQRSPILSTSVRAVFHTALVLSLYLLFAGHNAPGGGFVGGLVAGAAIVLRYVEGGVPSVRRVIPIAPPAVLGVGLLLAVGTGVMPWLSGAQFLETAKVVAELPLLGTVKATSALPFDIGVYCVVVGLALGIVDYLGEEATT